MMEGMTDPNLSGLSPRLLIGTVGDAAKNQISHASQVNDDDARHAAMRPLRYGQTGDGAAQAF